jgi:hypothetical protein
MLIYIFCLVMVEVNMVCFADVARAGSMVWAGRSSLTEQ